MGFLSSTDVASVSDMAGDALHAQVANAPTAIAARKKFDPQYTGLELAGMNNLAFGADGQMGLVDLLSKISQQTYGQGQNLMGAYLGGDPQSSALMQALTTSATNDLKLGGKLDPSARREVQQSVRAGQAARGMGYGPTDVFTEALETGRMSEQRKREREGRAGSMMSYRQNILNDLLGQITSQTGSFLGNDYAASRGSRMTFNPLDYMDASVQREGMKQTAMAGDRAFYSDMIGGALEFLNPAGQMAGASASGQEGGSGMMGMASMFGSMFI